MWIVLLGLLLLLSNKTNITFTKAATSYTLPSTEYEVLQDLFDSTNGSHWRWRTPYTVHGYPWTFQTPPNNPCSSITPWQGITCSSSCDTLPCSITEINLSLHYLRGSIPASVGNLTHLVYLSMYSNLLTGSMPTTLSNLTMLQQIILHDNKLTGSISSLFGNLQELQYLVLDYNRLTGSIPSALGNLTKLQYLDLDNNQLQGSIPPSLGRLKVLQELVLNNNQLTGSIPPALGDLDKLTYLLLDHNILSGSIPTSLSNLNQLLYLYLGDNLLVGSIPSSLGNLDKLQYLALNTNQLTNSIPTSFSNLNHLQDFLLNNNQLTGGVLSFANASFLDVHSNYLSGLVDALSTMEQCNQLLLRDNLFSGPLSSLAFPSIEVLDFSYNAFTGNISPFLFGNLTSIVYLNNNAFSGSISEELFTNKPQLQSMVLATNCFTGQLPSSICQPILLEQLILDGLHSVEACVSKALSFVSNSGLVSYNAVYGEIPGCLLQMPKISVLHLGSNDFSGTINSQNLSPTMTELVMASNALTGSIPSSVWHSNLTKLDLSLNRLRGVIPSDALPLVYSADNGSISLQVNQLSGKIPSAWKSLPSIEILQGNLFECNSDRGDLPQHDPEYESYSCGSDSANNSLIVAITTLCFMVGVAFFLVMLKTKSQQGMLKVWHDYRLALANYNSNRNLREGVQQLEWTNFVLAGYIVTVVLLVNGLLSIQFSSYTESYVWAVSGIYLVGWTPCICVFVYLSVLLCIIIFYCHPSEKAPWHPQKLQLGGQSMTEAAKNEEEKKGDDAMKRKLWTNILLLLDIVVILFVNGLYVSAYQQHYSSGTLSFIAFLISVFKAAWNNLFLGGFDTKDILGIEIQLSEESVIWLCLFNNLISPFLSELFVSPDCFLYIMSQAPLLTFSYTEYTCFQVVFQIVCQIDLERQVGSTYSAFNTLIPSFHYSYQCSFALISNYTYVFIFRYVLSGLVGPFMSWVLLTHRDSALLRLVPKKISVERWSSLWMLLINWQGNKESTEADKVKALAPIEKKLRRPGRLRQRKMSRFVTDFGMLLCFGTLFPPLALVIFVSMNKEIVEMKLGLHKLQEMLLNAQQSTATSASESVSTPTTEDDAELAESNPEYNSSNTVDGEAYTVRLRRIERQIEEEVFGAMYLIWTGVCYAVLVSVCIWTFVLFDILAAQEGVVKSAWVVVLMMSCPYLLYVGKYLYVKYHVLDARGDSKQHQERESAMKEHEYDNRLTMELVHVVNPLRV